MYTEEVYIKGKDIAFIDNNNQFLYQVRIYCQIKKYYCLIDNVLYSSPKELSFVRSFQYNAVTRISCELFSAPYWWLLENRFVKHIPIDKKKTKTNKLNNEKPQIEINRSGSGKPPRRSTRSRAKKL